MSDQTLEMETNNPAEGLPVASAGSLSSTGIMVEDELLSKCNFSQLSLTDGGGVREDNGITISGTDDAYEPEPTAGIQYLCRTIVLSFREDQNAKSRDPEQIRRNYWLPMAATGNKGMPVVLIVSPEFATKDGREEGKGEEFLLQLAKYKGERRISRSIAQKLARSSWEKVDLKPSFSKSMKAAKCGKPDKDKRKLRPKKESKRKGSKSVKPKSFEDTLICSVVEGKNLYEVKGRSLAYLNSPTAHLNDEIIDYFMMYFFTDGLGHAKKTQLFKLVTQKGERPDMLKNKFLIIPVVRESHWFLMVVCRPFPKESTVKSVLKNRPLSECSKAQAKEIYKKWHEDDHEQLYMLFFDSMDKAMMEKCNNYDSFIDDTVQYILRATELLHKMYWEENGAYELVNAVDLSKYNHKRVNTPAQPNSADCGIFTVANLLAWLCVTKRQNQHYLYAWTIDFTLLFSSEDLSSERLRMLHFLKKQIPENAPPTPLSLFEAKEETTVVDFDFNGTQRQSMLVPTSPPSNSSDQVPFTKLFAIVDYRAAALLRRVASGGEEGESSPPENGKLYGFSI